MYMMFRYASGRRAEAVVLSSSRERMRIVVRNCNDTIELRLVGGRWVPPSGNPIEIESLIADNHTATAGGFPARYARTLSANAAIGTAACPTA